MAPLNPRWARGPRRALAFLLVSACLAACDRGPLAEWLQAPLSRNNFVADGVTQSTPLIVGRVVDAAGAVVAGAKVKVYEGLFTALDGTTQSTPFDGTTQSTPFDGTTQTTPFDGTVLEPRPEARAGTGSNGEFAVPAPDRRVLSVEAWDGRHNRAARLGIAVDPRSERIDIGTLRLAPEAAMAGHVRTPPGVSPEGTAVFVPGTDHVTRADASGGYRLAELPAAVTAVAAVRPGFRPAVASGLSVVGGQTIIVPDLVLEPERLVLQALAPSAAGPGAEIVLAGEGFGHSGLRPLAIRFNRLKASQVTRVSDSEVRVIVPSGARSGPVDVVVEGDVSASLPFTVVASLSIVPGELKSVTDATARFQVVARDTSGNEVPGTALAWAVQPADLGTLDASAGTFKPARYGFGTVTVATGRIKARASLGFGDWRVEPLIGTDATMDARPGPLEGPASEVQWWYPTSLAIHPDGRLLFGNTVPYPGAGTHNVAATWIRSLDSAGTVRMVAGTGVTGYDGDGLPALQSRLGSVRSVAVAPGRATFVVDWGVRRVRAIPEIDAPLLGRSLLAGLLYDVLGNGEPGPKGYGNIGLAGLPPLETSLIEPSSLAWDPAGKLIVASVTSESGQSAGRIVEVSDAGEIATVLEGTAVERGFAGDRADPFSFPDVPHSLAVDPRGNLVIGTNSHVWLLCRKAGTYWGVTANAGDLVVIAGTGSFTTRQENFTGDETPARAAALWNVRGVAVRDGRIFLADSGFGRVREIDAGGRIRTIAGGGANPDGFALGTRFASPNHLAAAPDGTLYLADGARIVRLRR